MGVEALTVLLEHGFEEILSVEEHVGLAGQYTGVDECSCELLVENQQEREDVPDEQPHALLEQPRVGQTMYD